MESGELLLRYQHTQEQNFYALSWSTLDLGNILASGSDTGEIRLFDLNRELSFHNWTYKKAVPINSVIFHSREPSWLFTASEVITITISPQGEVPFLLGWNDLSVGHR